MNNKEFISNHILKLKYIKKFKQEHLDIINLSTHNDYIIDNDLMFNSKFIILDKKIFLEFNNFEIFNKCSQEILDKWHKSKYSLKNIGVDNTTLNYKKLDYIRLLHNKYNCVLPSIIFEDDDFIIFEKKIEQLNIKSDTKINIYNLTKKLLSDIDEQLYITFNVNNFISNGKVYNNVLNININYFNLYFITDDKSTVYIMEKTETQNYIDFIKNIFVNTSDFTITYFFDTPQSKKNLNNLLLNFMEDI